MNDSSFRLQKLYLDCIDPNGNCFILYFAKLRYYFLRLNYTGIIYSGEQDDAFEKSSLTSFVMPSVNRRMEIGHPGFKYTGLWNSLDNPVEAILFHDHQGHELFWDCHHPKSNVSITYLDKTYSGYGYAETLSLPIKPWLLPLDELRWGRFLSGENTIIWICWKGSHPLNRLFYNGKLYEDAAYADLGIVFNQGNCVLLFEQPVIVHKGKLSNVIEKYPWLKWVFNNRFLGSVEIKYKARSTFTDKKGEPDKGWSLFEIVTWKK